MNEMNGTANLKGGNITNSTGKIQDREKIIPKSKPLPTPKNLKMLQNHTERPKTGFHTHKMVTPSHFQSLRPSGIDSHAVGGEQVKGYSESPPKSASALKLVKIPVKIRQPGEKNKIMMMEERNSKNMQQICELKETVEIQNKEIELLKRKISQLESEKKGFGEYESMDTQTKIRGEVKGINCRKPVVNNKDDPLMGLLSRMIVNLENV